MGQETKVEVINKFGWGKEFVLDKPIVQIGRDDRNDIVLDDGHDSGIAPRHAQLLPSSINRQGVRLVNLSNSDIVVLAQSTPPDGAGVTVPPRAAAEISNGDRIKMGDFTLVFHGGEQHSEVVKLTLDMPSTELELDHPLNGSLTINHVGNKAAVQFKIELDGLDADSYVIGPGPVLFPNAEKQVSFRLNHPKKPQPPAGDWRITFHVTAPDAYPDERASISKDIQIAPYYRHKMRLVIMDSPEYQLA